MLLDALRRQAGSVADTWGLGPVETPWRQVASLGAARLRAYHRKKADGPALLIIPAPFKRPYIWDLHPAVSVVRACLARGLRVFLLEWLRPNADQNTLGLGDYALDMPERAVAAIRSETGAVPVHLAGHSLGGTFAAIFASRRPGLVGRLALVDAPLAFAEDGGPLAAAVARIPPVDGWAEAKGRPVAGSAINLMSGTAAREAFVWQRRADFLASLASPDALALHARVERWTLDEFPLPAQLFRDLAEDLYRDDRFRRGTLRLGSETAALAQLKAPVLAVLNPAGRIVPPDSILKGLRIAGSSEQRLLHYEPETGVLLQHLGPLVGRAAHRRLWPQIIGWISTGH